MPANLPLTARRRHCCLCSGCRCRAQYRDLPQGRADGGIGAGKIHDAIFQCWVAGTVVLTPTAKEATAVAPPYFQQMQTYHAAQSTAFEVMVAKANAQPGLLVLRGLRDRMLEDFTSLEKIGIGGVCVRFQTGPMPAWWGGLLRVSGMARRSTTWSVRRTSGAGSRRKVPRDALALPRARSSKVMIKCGAVHSRRLLSR
jgi:hypothetical protein